MRRVSESLLGQSWIFSDDNKDAEQSGRDAAFADRIREIRKYRVAPGAIDSQSDRAEFRARAPPGRTPAAKPPVAPAGEVPAPPPACRGPALIV